MDLVYTLAIVIPLAFKDLIQTISPQSMNEAG